MSSDSDLAVQETSNDASSCKRYAVQKGYWHDPFVAHMVKSAGGRKQPEISRGYYARTESVWQLVKKFITVTKKNCQIVSLGAGLDTTFWRLYEHDLCPLHYVELDFPNITGRKVHMIKSKAPLMKPLYSEDNSTKFDIASIISQRYSLLPVDLRDLQAFAKELHFGKIDFSIPTLFLAECVLVYMASEHSNAILKWITEHFKTSIFLNYEQVNMGDRFGKVMVENLKSRDCGLPGVDVCQSVDTQRQRFLDNGWDEASCITMWSAYFLLPQADVQRIEQLELMDEKELLEQLLQHYCICWATKGGSEIGLTEIEL